MPSRLAADLAGRYRIERELGAGGMATVYLARDVKHNRQVAVKVLHPELSAVLGGERFLKEIELTANLQHPHILPLFDSGEAAGQLFYVMPFVEGETLRARLEREKQLPIPDALTIAREVADALQYAHDRGVIHRDIKPENILLQGGHALVADFGIALAVQQAGGTRMTQTGLSLGTPQYMAPEQAMGEKTVDARADIYALGAVTYEMLAGEPPFTGPTQQAIVARLLTERPRPITANRDTVPPHVEGVVLAALAKLPADRPAGAGAFAAALDSSHAARPASHIAGGATTRSSVRPREIGLALLALIATGFAIWPRMTAPPPEAPVGRFPVLLPDSTDIGPGGAGGRLALTADGKRLAIAARAPNEYAIYTRELDSPTLTPLRGTTGARSPAFSPDGRWLAYTTEENQSAFIYGGARIHVVSAAGGDPILLADSARDATWIDNDRLLFSRRGEIWSVRRSGDAAERVARPDSAAGIAALHWPQPLPGGAHALVSWWRRGDEVGAATARIGVLTLSTGALDTLDIGGINATYAAPGLLVFGSGRRDIMVAGFSLRTRTLTTPPSLMLQGLDQGDFGSSASFALSANGTFVHVDGIVASEQHEVIIVDRRQNAQVISQEVMRYRDARASPDGQRIAVAAGANASSRVVIFDVASRQANVLTTDGEGRRPEWTRDGTRILFVRATRADSAEVLSRPSDQSGPTMTLFTVGGFNRGGGGSLELSLGPSGASSAIRRGTVGPGMNIPSSVLVASADSLSQSRPLFTNIAPMMAIRVSPDGRLLAYASTESGRSQVFVTPLPGPGPRLQVSVDGGSEPAWARTGTTLFYRSGDAVDDGRPPGNSSWLMAATLTSGATLQVSRQDTVFADHYMRNAAHGNFDVLPDGRFVMIRQVTPVREARPRPVVITNWQHLAREALAGQPRN